MSHLTATRLRTYLTELYPGLRYHFAYAEHTYFYNPDDVLKRGVYFCTIKERDGAKDSSSDLDRDGVYRLSFGIGKPAYTAHFGLPPTRPPKGIQLSLGGDFTATGILTPHPVYAWMGWVAVNQPTAAQLEDLLPLLDAAFARIQENYRFRLRNQR